jgi:hypothetical protein
MNTAAREALAFRQLEVNQIEGDHQQRPLFVEG